MSVVDPIFGRTAVNAASSCGCTCTQTTPTAPSFNSVWTGQRDSGGGCACTCNTTIEYNLSIARSCGVFFIAVFRKAGAWCAIGGENSSCISGCQKNSCWGERCSPVSVCL